MSKNTRKNLLVAASLLVAGECFAPPAKAPQQGQEVKTASKKAVMINLIKWGLGAFVTIGGGYGVKRIFFPSKNVSASNSEFSSFEELENSLTKLSEEEQAAFGETELKAMKAEIAKLYEGKSDKEKKAKLEKDAKEKLEKDVATIKTKHLVKALENLKISEVKADDLEKQVESLKAVFVNVVKKDSDNAAFKTKIEALEKAIKDAKKDGLADDGKINADKLEPVTKAFAEAKEASKKMVNSEVANPAEAPALVGVPVVSTNEEAVIEGEVPSSVENVEVKTVDPKKVIPASKEVKAPVAPGITEVQNEEVPGSENNVQTPEKVEEVVEASPANETIQPQDASGDEGQGSNGNREIGQPDNATGNKVVGQEGNLETLTTNNTAANDVKPEGQSEERSLENGEVVQSDETNSEVQNEEALVNALKEKIGKNLATVADIDNLRRSVKNPELSRELDELMAKIQNVAGTPEIVGNSTETPVETLAGTPEIVGNSTETPVETPAGTPEVVETITPKTAPLPFPILPSMEASGLSSEDKEAFLALFDSKNNAEVYTQAEKAAILDKIVAANVLANISEDEKAGLAKLKTFVESISVKDAE